MALSQAAGFPFSARPWHAAPRRRPLVDRRYFSKSGGLWREGKLSCPWMVSIALLSVDIGEHILDINHLFRARPRAQEELHDGELSLCFWALP